MFARRPIILFGKWRGPVQGTFELTGTTGLGAYSSSVDVSSVQPDEGNRAIRYLWARSKIAELSDYGSSDVADEQVKEITGLGLKYNLLTQYTSFIAVREKIVNPNGDVSDVNQAVPIPLGVSDMAIGSEPELIAMILLAMAIAAAAFIRRRFDLIPELNIVAK
jgi:Ca-activated chloride channel family protein